jgi:hypothetical protein
MVYTRKKVIPCLMAHTRKIQEKRNIVCGIKKLVKLAVLKLGKIEQSGYGMFILRLRIRRITMINWISQKWDEKLQELKELLSDSKKLQRMIDYCKKNSKLEGK